MKIQAIGTGSMWNKYNSSSFLIDEEIMIDMPNGVCKNLYKIDIEPNQIKNIILTHFHADHYFDIPFYLLNCKFNNVSDNKIYCSIEGNKKIKDLLNLAFPQNDDALKKITFVNTEKFIINNYEIERILVDHGKLKPCWGYIFKNGNKQIGFTGDTCLCENVKIMADKCDYLFCECTLLEGNNSHIGINDIKYLSNNTNCKFIVTHLNDETRECLKK